MPGGYRGSAPPPRRAAEDSPAWAKGLATVVAIGGRVFSPRVRAAIGVASLLTVAIVPGAAMAAGAITVAADAYCTFGSFCLYSGPNFNGQKVEYKGDDLFCQNSRPALNVRSVCPTAPAPSSTTPATATPGSASRSTAPRSTSC